MAKAEEFKVFDLNTDISISNHWRIINTKLSIVRKPHKVWNYYMTAIRIGGKLRNFLTHRLVAYAFLGLDIFDSNTLVLHKDDNWYNNHIDNLSLGSHQDNTDDMISKWRWRYAGWDTHYRTKITKAQKEEIKLLYSKWGIVQRRIWEMYWIRQDRVSRIVNEREKKR